MISNVETQLIFCDFLTSCNIDLPTDKITEECYRAKKDYNSNSGSNVGGWQSPKLEKSPYPETQKLQEVVNKFTISHLQRMGFICSDIFSAFWININSNTNYNTIHTHGRADCIGVYFVKSPEGSGDLGVLRNDGCSYTSLNGSKNINFCGFIDAPPDEGVFYLLPGHVWHHVQQEELLNDDRISIAFNFYIR